MIINGDINQSVQYSNALISSWPVPELTSVQSTTTPNGRLHPDTFTKKRANADTYMQQWELYWMINNKHVNIQNPFKWVVTALHFIRWPNVNDWVEEQLTDLTCKVTAAVNPIALTSKRLWNEFEQAFRTTFTNTTKEKLAHTKLFKLKMRPGGLNNYIATFKHLAKQAGYDLQWVKKPSQCLAVLQRLT